MQRLGKYEIISEIGRGAMGAVYKARDPLIGRLVALKTITTATTVQADSLERFYQEARSAGALQHPNIVTIYELGHENNTPFIAMEFIEGGSLDHLIEQRQVLPLSVKLGYIVRVCDALSFAHQHNVVHRDIKPANIMVTQGAVKVVDFGIARLSDMSLTRPNMMIGSRAYMSPQLYKGERADARADIWAVGVTLYELLAYRRPFLGDSEAELMFQILTDDPPALQSLVADCPDEVSRIVGKMLAKKLEERYASMEEILRDLEPIWKSAQQATVEGLLADSQQLIAANDPQRAQGLLRKALQIDVGNTQAKSLLERVTSELRRSQFLPKLNEHLERGRNLLRTGMVQEARAEADAALGLDSQNESAKHLFAEVEAAAARAQEVEQKLRLTKQRLAEGALTEAATALGQALALDSANTQGLELRRQIEEEERRREKRKKTSDVLHQARMLWTALNYEDCLKVLSEGLRKFPGESELLKLQEMARHDLEDLQKQRQLGEVRKFLGQQDFAQARKIIDGLAKTYPQDPAVNNLQMLVLDGEKEQQRSIRFGKELSDLRALLGRGNFGEAVSKGEELFWAYPEEFELKELLEYARGEVAQQEQRQSEKDRENEIRNFIAQEHFQDAEAAAKRAALEFPKQELFRKLSEEAGHKRRSQEQHERARQEMNRRISEIQGHIQQGKIGDAIDLAQHTLVTYGPDRHVTELLESASSKQAERKKKEDQDRQIQEAQSLVDAGNFVGATQLLSRAMADHVLERSDPRVRQQLQTIERLSNAAKSRPDAGARARTTAQTPSRAPAGLVKNPETSASSDTTPPQTDPSLFSATMVVGSRPAGTPATVPPAIGRAAAPRNAARAKAAAPIADTSKPAQGFIAAGQAASEKVKQWAARDWAVIGTKALAILKKPVVLIGMGALLVVVLTVVLVAGHLKGPSEKEKMIHDQADQFWKDHQLDQSEQAWRQLRQLRGYYGGEATRQIAQIEERRVTEKQRFDEGERLLNDEKNFPAASQAFQDVVGMNLWLAENAQRELAVAQALSSANDIRSQEKLHFDQGEKLFQSQEYEKARSEFQIVEDLKVADSTIRPQAENYLKLIRQAAETMKLYEMALGDFKNENWAAANKRLQEVLARKGSMSGEAKQRLTEVEAVEKSVEVFSQSLQAGAYRNARIQLDNMQWPKTKASLLQDLRSAEQSQAKNIENRAKTLQAGNDVDGLERLRDELHNFAGRIEDDSLVQWARDLDKWIVDSQQILRQAQSDRASFDAAVADFNTAKEKGDLNRMSHEVLQRFDKIAKGSGAYRDPAQTYVSSRIPAAMQEMAKTQGLGKAIVPPIECSGRQSPAAPPANPQGMTCARLDAGVSVQWLETPTVEFPSSASQPGKLPYTLHLIVTVEANGKVKVDKDGNVDKDFLNKAKDASKTWKVTIPKSGGKPVSVSFPLAITFRR